MKFVGQVVTFPIYKRGNRLSEVESFAKDHQPVCSREGPKHGC